MLDEVELIAVTLMNVHGLGEWTFTYDRARRRAGLCSHRRKTISLSVNYVRHNWTINRGDVIDTILHEIAHALVGPGQGHNAVWRAMCVKVGAKPIRCYDSSVVVMPSLYAAVRPCPWTFKRNRLGRDRQYFCRYCKTTLNYERVVR